MQYEGGISLKSKIKAQAFDCMQYFYGAVQEPRIRTFIKFYDHINLTALKKAVMLSVDAVPIIGCVFDEKRHCWVKRTFKAADFIHTADISDENQASDFLLSSIDHTCEPQVKIFLLRGKQKDSLCVIINHMVTDGAGFKEYLYLLCHLYSRCEENPSYRKKQPFIRRDFNQISKNLSIKEKLDILFSKSNSKPNPNITLPLKGGFNPIIVMAHLEKEQFSALKSFAKVRHVSINDIFLTAYIRLLHNVTGYKKITVPCPVDLRKYKKTNQRCGICNLTGCYLCGIEIKPNESFADTLKKVSSQMRNKKKSNECIKGPMLYNILFHTMPFSIVQRLFGKISPVPVTSYTNLGIIDDINLHFGNQVIEDAYISTAVKKAPYFQLSVSTFKKRCTFTSSMYGTDEDKELINLFLNQIINEIILNSTQIDC